MQESEELGLSIGQIQSAIAEWSAKVERPYERGVAALYQGEFQAVGNFDLSMFSSANGFKHYMAQASAEYYQGKSDQAERALQYALNLRGQDPIILMNLGIMANERGDLGNAESYYQRALANQEKLAPSNLDIAAIWNALGSVALHQGNAAKAEEQYRKALSIEHMLAPYSFQIVDTLENLRYLALQRNVDESQKFARQALAIRRKLAEDLGSKTLFVDDDGLFRFSSSDAAGTQHRHAQFDIASGGILEIVNPDGSIVLHPSNDQQLSADFVVYSNKSEVAATSTGDRTRVDIRTHALSQQSTGKNKMKVDYEINVPPGISVRVTTATAPITVENLNGDLFLTSDSGQITVRNLAKSHLRIRAVTAPVSLTNVTASRANVQSGSGAVQLNGVTGEQVFVSTTTGKIDYHGDFSGGGDYILKTHSGNIDVTLPRTVSIDLSARSTVGSVESTYPLQQRAHSLSTPNAGTSLALLPPPFLLPSVELQSFSGTIHVAKE
jgi:tetratricopeptide (TPR) repeat protein